MGAGLKYTKYIIPLLVIFLGALAFQNCGQKLQANGDPYENPSFQSDQDFIDIPDDSSDNDGQSAPPAVKDPKFVSESICRPAVKTDQVNVVHLGKKNGSDSVYILLQDGRYKVYSWPAGVSPLIVNDSIRADLQITSFELVSGEITVKFILNGVTGSEKFSCQ